MISRLSGGGADEATALQRQLFITPLKQWDFATAIPNDLDRAGPMNLIVRGLALRQKNNAEATTLGAVYSKTPVEIATSICVEAQITVGNGRGGVGVFVDGAAPGASGLNPAELTIWCGPGGVSVGYSAEPTAAVRPIAPGPHTLRLKVSPTVAIAEVDGQQIWAGPHATGRSAIVGVRLAGTSRGQEPVVQSLRVLAP